MQSPFCHSLNNTLHILPCSIIISCRDKIWIIVSHLNLRKNFAFQYHYISLLLSDVLCPSNSRLDSVKCALVLFYSITSPICYPTIILPIIYLPILTHFLNHPSTSP
jgi:hypothetical protein